jgi:hypothetical protein
VIFKMASFALVLLIQEETRQTELGVGAPEKQVRMAGSTYVRGEAHRPKMVIGGIG